MSTSLINFLSTNYPWMYLTDSWVPLKEPHHQDTVCLSDTVLGPLGQGVVTLIQGHPVRVLLLTQPVQQPKLIHTAINHRMELHQYIKLKLET